MTQNIDALRKARETELEELNDDLAARAQAQLLLADAHENLSIRQIKVQARNREIAFLDAEIDRIEAEAADDPANVPLIPLVPATPTQPDDEEQE